VTPNPLDLITPAFVALRDTVIGARKTSKEELRTWFVVHVEPIDLLMREIYDNYAAGFETVIDLLTSGAEPAHAVQLLKTLRLEKVRDRQDVVATGEALADARRRRVLRRGLGQDFYKLYLAIDNFTVAAQPEAHLSYYTAFIENFESIVAAGKDPKDPSFYPISSPRNDPVADAISRIENCRHVLMPDAWGLYTKAYKSVRMACM
jgi:hypothetical protein